MAEMHKHGLTFGHGNTTYAPFFTEAQFQSSEEEQANALKTNTLDVYFIHMIGEW